ncbi:similar to Protein HSPC163 (predicted), isoform CRA_b [Rattus norvegicus]|uniref:Similar to Protein HSPC163 (Predicted), isoform CRA_b n=2 Tax=Rattus norvegicus TaxID=10116 RepID=A6JGJ4_RAT|nr:similar to Protein HSPC163 (predicted), isoform CRA_b [Rattus norvegicus]
MHFHAFLGHNSRHAACPGGAARSWFDGRSGGRGWRRWCSSSRSSTVVRSSSSLSTSYPWLKRAEVPAPSQGYRRECGRRIITLSDLECDYINARSCCSKLNKWVIPELVGHTFVTVLMLVSLHWVIFLLNLPVATWNIYRFIMVPSGNMGVFDPTEIHNRGQLKSHMKEAMIKLGFYLLCFFMYLYSMILALIND